MPPTTIQILFIGNSSTQRNDLPGLLAEMAAERNVHIRHHLIASLRTRWNVGRAREAIKNGRFDYVVRCNHEHFSKYRPTLPISELLRGFILH
jgi:hypothetical protein